MRTISQLRKFVFAPLLPLFAFLCTMGDFNVDTDCTMAIQIAVGLYKVSCNVPRNGDRTTTGECGYNFNSSVAHMEPFNKDDAQRIWEWIPQQHKDTPANANIAMTVAKAANISGNFMPNGCRTHLTQRAVTSSTTAFYITPGGFFIKGVRDSHKFIAFLYTNMDVGHRVKFYDMTGQEQYEWHECWCRNAKTHLRVEPQTRGLRGTNLGRITDVQGLEAALVRSPSASRRRPATHALNEQVWVGTARRLGFE